MTLSTLRGVWGASGVWFGFFQSLKIAFSPAGVLPRNTKGWGREEPWWRVASEPVNPGRASYRSGAFGAMRIRPQVRAGAGGEWPRGLQVEAPSPGESPGTEPANAAAVNVRAAGSNDNLRWLEAG